MSAGHELSEQQLLNLKDEEQRSQQEDKILPISRSIDPDELNLSRKSIDAAHEDYKKLLSG